MHLCGLATLMLFKISIILLCFCLVRVILLSIAMRMSVLLSHVLVTQKCNILGSSYLVHRFPVEIVIILPFSRPKGQEHECFDRKFAGADMNSSAI